MNLVENFEVGCDEAGRGPWAGPIIGAACKISNTEKLFLTQLGLKDSKALSQKKRQSFFNQFKNKICWSVGFVSASEIDELGLQRANVLAYERAVCKLEILEDQIIECDYVGAFENYWQLPHKVNTHIKGESKFISIATASVIAKVWRDEYMNHLSELLPEYCFNANAGYGTKDHIEALNKFGVTAQHRKSFAPIKKLLNI